MPAVTPAERAMVEAYVAGGSWKAAALLLRRPEPVVRARVAKMYRRHGVRNITELTLCVFGHQVTPMD